MKYVSKAHSSQLDISTKGEAILPSLGSCDVILHTIFIRDEGEIYMDNTKYKKKEHELRRKNLSKELLGKDYFEPLSNILEED